MAGVIRATGPSANSEGFLGPGLLEVIIAIRHSPLRGMAAGALVAVAPAGAVACIGAQATRRILRMGQGTPSKSTKKPS